MRPMTKTAMQNLRSMSEESAAMYFSQDCCRCIIVHALLYGIHPIQFNKHVYLNSLKLQLHARHIRRRELTITNAFNCRCTVHVFHQSNQSAELLGPRSCVRSSYRLGKQTGRSAAFSLARLRFGFPAALMSLTERRSFRNTDRRTISCPRGSRQADWLLREASPFSVCKFSSWRCAERAPRRVRGYSEMEICSRPCLH